MNLIDLLILVLVAVGTVRGYATGIIRQILGIMGVIVAFLLSIQLMSGVGIILEQETAISEGFGPLAAFVLIFLIILLGARVASRMIESVLKMLRLSMLNRVAGGLFGAFQATILLSVLFLVLAEIGIPGEDSRESATLYEPVAVVFPLTWDEVARHWPRLRQVSNHFGTRIEAELQRDGD